MKIKNHITINNKTLNLPCKMFRAKDIVAREVRLEIIEQTPEEE